MPNAYVNKVVANNETKLDLTGDTVNAAHLAQGYTAHDASGQPIVGTMSGGGGLVYETGTWTPAEDASTQWITFANIHTEAPFYYAVFDATGTYDNTSQSNYMIEFLDVNKLSGKPYYLSSTSVVYARYFTVYRTTNTTNLSTGGGNISTSDVSSYATNEKILASVASSSRYWRAGRTYKWVAVWVPTS